MPGDQLHRLSALLIDPHQGRLRALWRLLLQILLAAFLSLAGQLFLYLILPPSSARLLLDPEKIQTDPALSLLLFLGQAAAVTASVWAAGRFLDRRPFGAFGFKIDLRWWVDFGFGLSLGAGLMLLIFAVELLAGWVTVTGTLVRTIPGLPFAASVCLALLLFVVVGFYEELLSRGYQLLNLAEGLSASALSPRAALALAVAISSLFFALLHSANPHASALSALNIFLGGIFLSTGFILTGQLAIPIGLHISWNFFQGNVFGFPVSGIASRLASFLAIQQSGPELWTGGPFGPEAGLLGMAGSLLGMLAIYLFLRLRYRSVSLFLPSYRRPAAIPTRRTDGPA